MVNFVHANVCSIKGIRLLFEPVSTRPANAANHGSYLPLEVVLQPCDYRTN